MTQILLGHTESTENTERGLRLVRYSTMGILSDDELKFRLSVLKASFHKHFSKIWTFIHAGMNKAVITMTVIWKNISVFSVWHTLEVKNW